MERKRSQQHGAVFLAASNAIQLHGVSGSCGVLGGSLLLVKGDCFEFPFSLLFPFLSNAVIYHCPAITNLAPEAKERPSHPLFAPLAPVRLLEPAVSTAIRSPGLNAVCFCRVALLCFVLQIFTLAPDLQNTNIYQKLKILGTIILSCEKASIVPTTAQR